VNKTAAELQSGT